MTVLFTVHEATASPVPLTTLPQLKLEERAHLQEWILAHPDVLGEDVLVITSEYNRWAGADGTTAKDRLDILGLDGTGRLVVVELKRADGGRDVHLQAITYAALVSRFTLDTLAEALAAFRAHDPHQRDLTLEQARQLILDHVDGDLDPALLANPRLVLIAGTFPRTVTHTCVWLSEIGVDIDLVQVAAWQLPDGQPLVGFTKLYPTPEVEEFTLAPARAEQAATAQKVAERNRAATVVKRLVAAGALADGTALHLAPSHGTNPDTRAAIEDWVAADPRRGEATWVNDPTKPIRWAVNEQQWSPTALAQHILSQAAGVKAAIRGPVWWRTTAGVDLAELADTLPQGDGDAVVAPGPTPGPEPAGDAGQPDQVGPVVPGGSVNGAPAGGPVAGGEPDAGSEELRRP